MCLVVSVSVAVGVPLVDVVAATVIVPPDWVISFWSDASAEVNTLSGVRPAVMSTGVTVDSSVAEGSFSTTMVPSLVKRSQPFGTAI